MPRIFISYRRSDSITITGRMYDRLVEAFGEDHVFKDVDDIPVGVDFRAVLNREVSSADVLLVVIGKEWLNARDEQGRRRLDDPNDFVRIEVEHGLSRRAMLVIPVLVHGATMPSADDLPESLRELAFRNAAIVRDDPDFRRDIGRLIDQIRKFEEQEPPTTRIKPVAPPPSAPIPDPFEDLVPSTPQPAMQAGFAAHPHPGAISTPKPSSQMKWVWIIGAIILLMIGCYVCQYVVSLQNTGVYWY